MRKLLQKYLGRHFSFDGVFRSEAPEALGPKSASKKKGRSMAALLFFLRLLPILCIVGFGVSFFYDIPATKGFVLWGHFISLGGLIRILSVSGLIGFGTNWVAIKMLFRPAQPRPIFGQGLIPAQKDEIIERIAQAIHTNILSEELIRKRIAESGILTRLNDRIISGTEALLHDEEFRTELKAFVHDYLTQYMEREDIRVRFSGKIDEKLGENLDRGLKGFLFRSYRNFREKDYRQMLDRLIMNLPDAAVEALNELEDRMPFMAEQLRERRGSMEAFLNRMVRALLAKIDIARILRKQMAHFDEQKLEKMIWEATNQQLLYIQYMGCFLGVLGGLVIWQPPLVLGAFGVLFLCLFLLDTYLYRSRKASQKP